MSLVHSYWNLNERIADMLFIYLFKNTLSTAETVEGKMVMKSELEIIWKVRIMAYFNLWRYWDNIRKALISTSRYLSKIRSGYPQNTCLDYDHYFKVTYRHSPRRTEENWEGDFSHCSRFPVEIRTEHLLNTSQVRFFIFVSTLGGDSIV